VDRIGITGSVIEHYRERLDPGAAVCFCITRRHAEHVAAQFIEAGIPAAAIDGEMGRFQRADILGRLRRGELRILTSCDLISEGFDCPAVAGAILLRPTASLALHLQQVGRALRPKPDGSEAVILDHVGNAARHGLPDDPRVWSLEAAKRKAEQPKIRRCDACGAVFAQGQKMACPQADKPADCLARPQSRAAIVPPEVPIEQPGQLVEQTRRRERHEVDSIRATPHHKPAGQPTLRVTFMLASGPSISAFLAFDSPKPYARRIATDHWRKLSCRPKSAAPRSTAEAVDRRGELVCPTAIIVEPGEKWSSVVDIERHQFARRTSSSYAYAVVGA
jgi:hypothetical protein